MELTKDEKETIKFFLEKNLKELKGEEVTKDSPLSFFAAEEEYKKFLENLIKKF